MFGSPYVLLHRPSVEQLLSSSSCPDMFCPLQSRTASLPGCVVDCKEHALLSDVKPCVVESVLFACVPVSVCFSCYIPYILCSCGSAWGGGGGGTVDLHQRCSAP